MGHFRPSAVSYGAGLLALATATTASAQEAPGGAQGSNPDSQGLGLADIVVTAQKRTESLRDVPMSVTALTGDQLLERGISDAADLAKWTPGFSYVESGQSVPVYSLRGVGFFDTSIGARPTVSVYMDEVPLTFSIMTTGAALDLERVEVLKGPQGTLFGSNATGGAINYIAAKPRASVDAGLTATYARFDQFDVSGYITGSLGPDLKGRIAARAVRGGAWQQSYTRDDELGDQDFTQGRLLLDWEPSASARFTFNANGFIDKSDTQAGQSIAIVATRPQDLGQFPLLSDYPLSPRNNRAADWDPNTDLAKDNSFYQLSLRSEFDLTDAITLTSLTSYSNMDVSQTIDIDGLAINNGKILVNGSASSFTQELRLSGESGPVRWIMGGNYSADKSYEDGHSDFNYTTASAGFSAFPGKFRANNATGSQNFDSYALFGNMDYTLGTQFVVHGGARYTKVVLDYATCSRAGDAASAAAVTGFLNRLRSVSGLGPITPLAAGDCLSVDRNLAPGLLRGRLSENNISWRAGLDWKPARDMMLYASVSKGYKSGSSPVLNAFAQAAQLPVTQESVLAYEVGAKGAFANRRVDFSAAAFYYDYRDKQLKGRSNLPPAILGAIEALVNVPKARIYGFETQINVLPARGLAISVGFTYLNSKVLGSFPNFSLLGGAADFGGEAFPYTPDLQVSSDIGYETPVNSDVDVFVGSSLNYRTSTSAGFGDEPLLRLRDYALLDLRGGLKSSDGRWRVELFGRNVTNSYYWTNVARAFDVVRRLSGKPATYGITASFRFH